MLVDINSAEVIGKYDYPSLPEAECNVVRRYRAGNVEISFLRTPRCAGGEDLTYIHYSLVARTGDGVICVVSAESLDLRSLALSLGCSVKDVQRDYGTKGFLSPASLVIYGNGQRDDLGPVQLEMKEEFVLPYMMDYLLDSLDLADELEIIG